jgi:hypothetical protein
MASEFSKPADVPKANNVIGTPQPPSGEHQPIDTTAKITMLGSWSHVPSDKPADNIHGSKP